MTIVKSGKEEHEATFDCITQEAERQRVKHPERVDAIDAAERRTRTLVKDGKLEENLMLVEFTRALEKIWAPRISPRTLHAANRYASE
jgi:hypothetical protein